MVTPGSSLLGEAHIVTTQAGGSQTHCLTWTAPSSAEAPPFHCPGGADRARVSSAVFLLRPSCYTGSPPVSSTGLQIHHGCCFLRSSQTARCPKLASSHKSSPRAPAQSPQGLPPFVATLSRGKDGAGSQTNLDPEPTSPLACPVPWARAPISFLKMWSYNLPPWSHYHRYWLWS